MAIRGFEIELDKVISTPGVLAFAIILNSLLTWFAGYLDRRTRRSGIRVPKVTALPGDQVGAAPGGAGA